MTIWQTAYKLSFITCSTHFFITFLHDISSPIIRFPSVLIYHFSSFSFFATQTSCIEQRCDPRRGSSIPFVKPISRQPVVDLPLIRRQTTKGGVGKAQHCDGDWQSVLCTGIAQAPSLRRNHNVRNLPHCLRLGHPENCSLTNTLNSPDDTTSTTVLR